MSEEVRHQLEEVSFILSGISDCGRLMASSEDGHNYAAGTGAAIYASAEKALDIIEEIKKGEP